MSDGSFLERLRRHAIDTTPLRASRDFRRLFVGRSVSRFGDEIVAVVVPFQVYELTRSTLAVGLIGLVELVPVLVAPIVGGAFADALERRRLAIWTHALLALLSLAMVANALRPEPLLWPLYAFGFVSAGLITFARPTLDTWPARLLDLELMPSAGALDAGFGTFAGTVGPVAAGVLLATIAPAGAFLFDAATFLVVIAALARMAPSPPAEGRPDLGLRAIRDGFRFLRGRRIVQAVFLADLAAMVFGFPVALFPAIARERLGGGPEVLGLLHGALAAGAFLATLVSGRARHVRRQGRAIVVSIAIWGAAIAVLGSATWTPLALAMLAIAGAGDMVSGIFRTAILRSEVEDRLRGRLDGIGMAVWASGPALGNLESGAVAALAGVPFAVTSGGLLAVAGVLGLVAFAPAFWRYDAHASAG
ncbi:MAG: MFS transporter [Actinomycetota bacterium]